jgi:hypothetical protein
MTYSPKQALPYRFEGEYRKCYKLLRWREYVGEVSNRKRLPRATRQQFQRE